MRRTARVAAYLLLIPAFALPLSAARSRARDRVQIITVDGSASASPFPHFWEQMFGAGRAILSLRQSYREDLRDVKAVTSLRYVRFHGILDDEVGVYREDSSGHPVYNFSYVDQIYDGLLDLGVKPVVELDFMPRQLSADPAARYYFWYGPNVWPPKDYEKWEALVHALTQHLVDRYGIDEVAQWYFEVWNEPNTSSWQGNPPKATYFELYIRAARAIKAINPRLRVGGPATAYGGWIPDFIRYAQANHVPIDFVTGHVYGGDKPERVFGPNFTGAVSQDDMVCAAVRRMKGEILDSSMPHLPLLITEFNAGFEDRESYDSLYMGPFLAHTVRDCDGLATMMSFWTFSDVFEEKGPDRKPFHGGFGLVTAGGIFKPSYVAFEMLHKLGTVRLYEAASDALVTRRPDGTVVLAVWNMVDPGSEGMREKVILRFTHMKHEIRGEILRLDALNSDSLAAYQRMGSPRYPTQGEIQELRQAARLDPPEDQMIRDGQLRITLRRNELAVITLR